MNKKVRLIIVFAIGLALWFMPAPLGIKAQGWHLFAIFAATIAGCILQPLPIGAVAFISMAVSMLSGCLKVGQAIGGFSNGTIWMIVSACFFTACMVKTGLGERIAYIFMRMFGNSTLKLAYAMLVGDMCIAPVMPSNTARSGGIFYPIVSSLARSYKSEPGESAGKMGRFLLYSVFQGDNMITGMFMTGMGANVVAVGMAKEFCGVEVTCACFCGEGE